MTRNNATTRTSPTLKILGEIHEQPVRPRGLVHVRAARRNAEVSARYIASSRCSSALRPFIAAQQEIAKAEAAGATDLIDARADVAAVERTFAARCVRSRQT